MLRSVLLTESRFRQVCRCRPVSSLLNKAGSGSGVHGGESWQDWCLIFIPWLRDLFQWLDLSIVTVLWVALSASSRPYGSNWTMPASVSSSFSGLSSSSTPQARSCGVEGLSLSESLERGWRTNIYSVLW